MSSVGKRKPEESNDQPDTKKQKIEVTVSIYIIMRVTIQKF